jgi:hypothetical protein
MSARLEHPGAVTTLVIDRPAACNAIKCGAERFREGEGRHGRVQK